MVYHCAKQRSDPTSDKRGAKADEITLTPLELIDRIAALVPPPRTHRPQRNAGATQSEPAIPRRSARYLWAVLSVRIYKVFPLLCPTCGGPTACATR